MNVNNLSSERGESVLYDEDKFNTQSKIIPNSFNSTDLNDILDPKIGLREMEIQCPQKITVGHLNINSIRNKLDALSFIIDTNIDISLFSGTKNDDSFPLVQFRIKGFCTSID